MPGRSGSFTRRGGSRALVAAGAALLAVGAVFLWVSMRGRDGKALPASKMLAILPATDLTGREDGRQLCDGVSFSLGVKLQSVPNLAIMRPSSPAMLKETDVSKWARDTGANLLVQPAVRQMGDTRQLSFSISLAGSPVQIAAGEVTGPAAEHFRLEDELTQKLASALKGEVRPIEAKRLKGLTGADGGSIGPVGLKGFMIVADKRLDGANNLISGANKITPARLPSTIRSKDLSSDCWALRTTTASLRR